MDADLRLEYESALQRKRQKLDDYREQYELRKWQKKVQRRVEEELVQAYSHPPFNVGELEGML